MMNMFDAFFTPLIKQDHNIAESLFKVFYNSSRERLITRLEQPGLDELRQIFDAPAIETDNRNYWCAELGVLNELINTRPELLTVATAQLRLIDLALGDSRDFSLNTQPGERLYLDGMLVQTDSSLMVRFNADDCFDLIINGVVKRFRRAGNRLVAISGADNHRKMIAGVALNNLEARDPALLLSTDIDLPMTRFEDVSLNITAALAFIGDISPQYQLWIERVLRNINLVDVMQDNRTATRSSHIRPGSIVLSPATLLAQAENLVHECTHQYYYLCCLLTSIAKPAEPPFQTFYSPIVSQQRTIDMILLSYHATANILMFFDLVKNQSTQTIPFVDQRISIMGKMALDNYQILSANGHLMTDQGNQMWKVANSSMEALFNRYVT